MVRTCPIYVPGSVQASDTVLLTAIARLSAGRCPRTGVSPHPPSAHGPGHHPSTLFLSVPLPRVSYRSGIASYFSAWFMSLSIPPSRFTCVGANGRLACFLMAEFHCMCTTSSSSIHLLTDPQAASGPWPWRAMPP